MSLHLFLNLEITPEACKMIKSEVFLLKSLAFFFMKINFLAFFHKNQLPNLG